MWASTEERPGQLFADGGFLQRETEHQAAELQQLSTGIREFMVYVDRLHDPVQRETVRDGLKFLLRFHALGLRRILDLLAANGSEAGSCLMNRLTEDNIVSGLLLVHELHPLDCRSRLLTALEKMAPYLERQGVRVEFLSLESGIGKLKMSAHSGFHRALPATLELAVRQMVEEYCPDLTSLELQAMNGVGTNSGESLYTKENGQWWPVCELGLLGNGIPFFCKIDDVPIVVCRHMEYIYAFRNTCPACEMSLSADSIAGSVIQCTLGHRFDMQQAGCSVDDPEFRLVAFPLIAENGRVMVTIGDPVY